MASANELMVLRLNKVFINTGRTFEGRSVPHSPNRLNSLHWSKRYKWAEAWKTEVWAQCRIARVKMGQGKAKVGITLYTIKPQDKDNSVGSIKGILDGLKGIAIKDDAPDCIDLDVRTIKVNKKDEERVEITL